EEDARPAILPSAVPARLSQLPANPERHVRLAGSGGHGEQNAPLALKDGLDHAVDGDFLIIARGLSSQVVQRRQELRGRLLAQVLSGRQTAPKLVRRGKRLDLPLYSVDKAELDNAAAVGRVSELQSEDLGILLGLLNAFGRRLVVRLGLYHRDHVVPAESE